MNNYEDVKLRNKQQKSKSTFLVDKNYKTLELTKKVDNNINKNPETYCMISQLLQLGCTICYITVIIKVIGTVIADSALSNKIKMINR